ncbi:MAG: GNAT family protein [Planctomycetota bacterium]|nr:GNAT family protein [Planctomycetota bacterium]
MQTPHTPWIRPEPLPGFVETEHLVLRWWQPEDAAALHAAVASDRAALLPWLPWAATTHATIEDSAATIAFFTEKRDLGEDYTMGAFDRTTGEAVGGTGFHRLVPEAEEAECGYWIRGSRQREGLCTEMTRAILTAGFRDWGFRRIHLTCAGGNMGSRGVLAKIGIPQEGCDRQARWIEGVGYDDHLHYGVLAHEWDLDAQAMRVPTE